MNLEETLKLFDSCWFEMEIFKNPSNSLNRSNSTQNLDHKIKENLSQPRIDLSTRKRSTSDDLSSRTSFLSDPFSPKTVLVPERNLESTVVSGKKIEEDAKIKEVEQSIHARRSRRSIRRKKKKKKNRSLSDLEMEELKGFMDLGFVFTEEDRDSELAEILPGLQRFLGERNKNGEPEDEEEDRRKTKSPEISRPYLSEAWDVDVNYHQRRRNKKGLMTMDLRLPALSNEMAMKDNLRWWAHTVASSVR